MVRYEPLMVPLTDLRWTQGGEMDPGVSIDTRALPNMGEPKERKCTPRIFVEVRRETCP